MSKFSGCLLIETGIDLGSITFVYKSAIFHFFSTKTEEGIAFVSFRLILTQYLKIENVGSTSIDLQDIEATNSLYGLHDIQEIQALFAGFALRL